MVGEVTTRDTPADRLDISLAYIVRIPNNPYGWMVRSVARQRGVDVNYNPRRHGKRSLADLFFIRQWRAVMGLHANIERHCAYPKRYFGLKRFHIQGYPAVTQFVFSVCSAALIVAFVAARCRRPDLATSRLKVVAFVDA